MDTSLYIFNDRLAAIMGRCDAQKRLRISAFAETQLAEGSVINGVVTDEAGFLAGVSALKNALGKGAFQRVYITTGSGSVFLKRAVVPRQQKKKLMEWVGNEFSDVEAPDDQLLFDIVPLENLGPDKGEAALLLAAKKSLVSAYDELMRAAGAKLMGVDSTHVSMLKLLRLLPGTSGRTFILLSFDGNILDATLYVDGQYRFMNRTRLFQKRGSAESVAEVERTVSAILQFHASERGGQPVTDLYFAGANDDEIQNFTTLGAAFNLSAAPLEDGGTSRIVQKEGFSLPANAAAAGNLIRGDGGANFLPQLRAMEKKEKGSKKKLLPLMPIAVIALALFAVAAVVSLRNGQKITQLDALQQEITELGPAYEEAEIRSERYGVLSNEYDGLYAGRLIFTVYPELTSALFSSVAACAQGRFTINVYSYDETERLLTLDAAVDSVNEVPGFAERLRDTGRFERVSYTGYTSDSDGVYYCTVYCVLNMPESHE